MKKQFKTIGILFAVSLALSACSGGENPVSTPVPSPIITATPEASPTSPPPSEEQKYILIETIDSKYLADNQIGEDTQKKVYVYLPPSYYSQTEKKYPVIYNLHGYGDGPFLVTQKAAMDKYMTENPKAEFIIVEPYGTNKLGGSFYANSPVIGGWEDYLSQELVQFIDTKYRTLADKDSRGIAGFSMGGFGALNIGFNHPDVFSSILALGPGLWDENGLKDALSVWDKTIRNSYGAAFSPDMSLPYPYAAIPALDGSEADNRIIENWENGFGNWPKKIEAYKALNVKLNAVTIVYGTQDGYKFIRNGAPYVSSLLTENGIENTLLTFNGGHLYPPNYATEYALPFFAEHLKTAE